MAGTAATTLTIVGAASAVGSSVMRTLNNYTAEKQAAEVAGYNAQVARNDAQRMNAEYAMNAGLMRMNARQQIGSAKNEMAASGNIGPSADAAVLDAYFNLSSDLAAMKYQYDNRAINYLNQAQNFDYNKKVAKRNKTSAIIGGVFDTVAAGTYGYLKYSDAGGKYGLPKALDAMKRA